MDDNEKIKTRIEREKINLDYYSSERQFYSSSSLSFLALLIASSIFAINFVQEKDLKDAVLILNIFLIIPIGYLIIMSIITTFNFHETKKRLNKLYKILENKDGN